jgi:hypothetical protein
MKFSVFQLQEADLAFRDLSEMAASKRSRGPHGIARQMQDNV